MPAQRLFQVSSSEAVVNARLVTVRAPIAGVVGAGSHAIEAGRRIDAGVELASVNNPRIDRSGLNSALEDIYRANDERDALAARLKDAVALRDSLKTQLDAFHSNRIKLVDAEIAAADARIASALIVAERAQSEQASKANLGRKGITSASAIEDATRDAEVAHRAVDEARANRDALSVELQALKNGVYLGDGYNDQPRSAQRLDEVEQSIAGLKADLAMQDSRIARANSTVQRERQRLELQSSAKLDSPVAGRVWEVLTAPGEQVVAGQPLYSILDCSASIVTAAVSEAVYNSLSVGSPATFTFREGGHALAGKVVQLSGVASASSNFAITPSALTKEPYRVAVAVKQISSHGSCPVGRTGRVVFGSAGS